MPSRQRLKPIGGSSGAQVFIPGALWSGPNGLGKAPTAVKTFGKASGFRKIRSSGDGVLATVAWPQLAMHQSRPKPTTLGTLDPIRGLNRWRQPTLQVVAISQQSRLTETGSPHRAGQASPYKRPGATRTRGLDDRREWHLLLTMGHARFFIARTPKLVLRILVPRPKFANDCREQRCRY